MSVVGPRFSPEDDSSTSSLLVLSAFSTLQLLPEQELPGSFGRYDGWAGDGCWGSRSVGEVIDGLRAPVSAAFRSSLS